MVIIVARKELADSIKKKKIIKKKDRKRRHPNKTTREKLEPMGLSQVAKLTNANMFDRETKTPQKNSRKLKVQKEAKKIS